MITEGTQTSTISAFASLTPLASTRLSKQMITEGTQTSPISAFASLS
jgi:hypothetical protein